MCRLVFTGHLYRVRVESGKLLVSHSEFSKKNRVLFSSFFSEFGVYQARHAACVLLLAFHVFCFSRFFTVGVRRLSGQPLASRYFFLVFLSLSCSEFGLHFTPAKLALLNFLSFYFLYNRRA